MSLSDYSHWNEDATSVWWQEEGRHEESYEEYDYYDEPHDDAADLFAEEVADMTSEQIIGLLSDADYRTRWPLAPEILQWELEMRSA